MELKTWSSYIVSYLVNGRILLPSIACRNPGVTPHSLTLHPHPDSQLIISCQFYLLMYLESINFLFFTGIFLTQVT